MKYINQINMALVAAAGVAVILAFSQTYLSSEGAPRPVAPSTIQREAPAPGQTSGQDREVPPTASRPSNAVPPRAKDATAGRTSPGAIQRPSAQPAPGQRALPPRTTSSPPRPKPRQLDVGRPEPTTARPPVSRDARRRGPRFQPQPADQDEGPGQQPPPNIPRSPEARRDQNRRTNPNPPPARSSMPEQRPQF